MTRADRIHFPRRPDWTTRPGAPRAPGAARSSTRVLSPPRRQQHPDDCHTVDDVAIQYHPEHRVERKGANVDELCFVGGRLRVVEAIGQEQVRRLVDHALARVIRAQVHKMPCPIAGFLSELPLSRLLESL